MVTDTSASIQQAIADASSFVRVIDSNAKTNDFTELDQFHAVQLENARKTGHSEGNRGFPGDQGNAPFEAALTSQYGSQHSRLCANEINLLTRLYVAYNYLKDQFFQTLIGNMYFRVHEIARGFDQARKLHNRPGGETNAISWLLLNQWIVYLVIIIIGACEVPLNNTIFKAFRLDRIETAIITLILVLAVPILAHLGGKSLKRFYESSGYKTAAVVILAIFIVFAVSMGLFRYTYFNATDLYNRAIANGEDVLLSDLMRSIPVMEALTSSEFWVGFVLNIMLVAVGLLLGYFAHDSSSQFESHYLNYQKERPRILRQMALAVESEKRDAGMNGIAPQSEQYKERLNEIATLYTAVRQYLINFTRHSSLLATQAVETYRAENISARPVQNSVPTSWNLPFSINGAIRMPDVPEIDIMDRI